MAGNKELWISPASEIFTETIRANPELQTLKDSPNQHQLIIAGIGQVLAIRKMSSVGKAPLCLQNGELVPSLSGVSRVNLSGFWYSELGQRTPTFNNIAQMMEITFGDQWSNSAGWDGQSLPDGSEGLLKIISSAVQTTEASLRNYRIARITYTLDEGGKKLFQTSMSQLRAAGLTDDYDTYTSGDTRRDSAVEQGASRSGMDE